MELKDKFTSRKLVFQVLIFVVATILLFFGKIGASDWTELVKWTFGFYVASNVGASAVFHYKNKPLLTDRESKV